MTFLFFGTWPVTCCLPNSWRAIIFFMDLSALQSGMAAYSFQSYKVMAFQGASIFDTQS